MKQALAEYPPGYPKAMTTLVRFLGRVHYPFCVSLVPTANDDWLQLVVAGYNHHELTTYSSWSWQLTIIDYH